MNFEPGSGFCGPMSTSTSSPAAVWRSQPVSPRGRDSREGEQKRERGAQHAGASLHTCNMELQRCRPWVLAWPGAVPAAAAAAAARLQKVVERPLDGENHQRQGEQHQPNQRPRGCRPPPISRTQHPDAAVGRPIRPPTCSAPARAESARDAGGAEISAAAAGLSRSASGS